MAKAQLVKGTTSYIGQVFIQDSSSTTGAGLTGLAFGTASLTAYYHRDTDTTATAIALVTMTVGTFTSSGFKEIDATNMPGWYQICPPNAALASGAKSVGIELKGAANMAPCVLEIELTAVDNQSATAFMTSVASVVGAVGSVTGLTPSNLDTTISSRMATYTQPTGFLAATFPTGTVANTTNITAGTVTTATNLTTNNDKTGYAIGAGGLAAAGFATDAIDANALAASAATEIVTAMFARAFSAAYGSLTFDQMIKVIASALFGKCSGMATTTAVFRNPGDTADVITATVDSNGNRTAVTVVP